MITNPEGRVLLLKANYGKLSWSFPGGALEPGETFAEALLRECDEELGQAVTIKYLSGVYYHSKHSSQAAIFFCELTDPNKPIQLNKKEHSAHEYFDLEELNHSHKTRALDCLEFDGQVKFGKF